MKRLWARWLTFTSKPRWRLFAATAGLAYLYVLVYWPDGMAVTVLAPVGAWPLVFGLTRWAEWPTKMSAEYDQGRRDMARAVAVSLIGESIRLRQEAKITSVTES